MSRRRRGAATAYMVPRRAAIVTLVATELLLGMALTLVGLAHARAMVIDPIHLEIAAAAMLVVMISLGVLPLRLQLLNRKLERTLISLENGTVPVSESALGPLGAAFHEHFRLLRRSNQLQRGTIEVQRNLLEHLSARVDGKLLVLDGQGVVRYSSRALEGERDSPDLDAGPVHSNPRIYAVIADLLANGESKEVEVAGVTYFCYGVFGPVLLQPAPDGSGLLEPRDGLAFIILSDRSIDRAGLRRSRQDGVATPRRKGVGSTLERLFRSFR